MVTMEPTKAMSKAAEMSIKSDHPALNRGPCGGR
jgi:hypothetical protein